MPRGKKWLIKFISTLFVSCVIVDLGVFFIYFANVQVKYFRLCAVLYESGVFTALQFVSPVRLCLAKEGHATDLTLVSYTPQYALQRQS